MVRAAMTFALARTGPDAVARLVEYFASDKTALQVQGYLLELGPDALPGVTPALKSPSPTVRAGAADVVGALGTAESVALLEPLTKDRDRAVAESAVEAVERIKRRR